MAGSTSRRRGLIGFGAGLVLAGILGAVALYLAGEQRQQNTVEGFARAPVGCDTTLDFEETGEYVLYLERRGDIDEVRGDCDIEGRFAVTSAADPEVELQLVDPDGVELDLNRVIGETDYSVDGFEGSSLVTVDIDEATDHVIRVESPGNDAFAVAVGRDPSDGVTALRAGALAAGLIGVLLGLLLILLGSRRRAQPAAPAWTPQSNPPIGYTPGGPAPQGPPAFGQPGQAGPPAFQAPPPRVETPPQFPSPPVAPNPLPPTPAPPIWQVPAQPVAPPPPPPLQQPAPPADGASAFYISQPPRPPAPQTDQAPSEPVDWSPSPDPESPGGESDERGPRLPPAPPS